MPRSLRSARESCGQLCDGRFDPEFVWLGRRALRRLPAALRSFARHSIYAAVDGLCDRFRTLGDPAGIHAGCFQSGLAVELALGKLLRCFALGLQDLPHSVADRADRRGGRPC
ncbi:MAG: hypothetical protein NTZ79_14340 [Proteobacteria bacterium]|nr:hypothetical protein [Pseudomonadota bacterium]